MQNFRDRVASPSPFAVADTALVLARLGSQQRSDIARLNLHCLSSRTVVITMSSRTMNVNAAACHALFENTPAQYSRMFG
jgi:hypothetical protein